MHFCRWNPIAYSLFELIRRNWSVPHLASCIRLIIILPLQILPKDVCSTRFKMYVLMFISQIEKCNSISKAPSMQQVTLWLISFGFLSFKLPALHFFLSLSLLNCCFPAGAFFHVYDSDMSQTMLENLEMGSIRHICAPLSKYFWPSFFFFFGPELEAHQYSIRTPTNRWRGIQQTPSRISHVDVGAHPSSAYAVLFNGTTRIVARHRKNQHHFKQNLSGCSVRWFGSGVGASKETPMGTKS